MASIHPKRSSILFNTRINSDEYQQNKIWQEISLNEFENLKK